MRAIMLLDASGQKIEISLSTLNVRNVLQFYDTDHVRYVYRVQELQIFQRKEKKITFKTGNISSKNHIYIFQRC